MLSCVRLRALCNVEYVETRGETKGFRSRPDLISTGEPMIMHLYVVILQLYPVKLVLAQANDTASGNVPTC
jgi:hypothetical protein